MGWTQQVSCGHDCAGQFNLGFIRRIRHRSHQEYHDKGTKFMTDVVITWIFATRTKTPFRSSRAPRLHGTIKTLDLQAKAPGHTAICRNQILYPLSTIVQKVEKPWRFRNHTTVLKPHLLGIPTRCGVPQMVNMWHRVLMSKFAHVACISTPE